MKLTGKQLSNQAREVINNEVLEWLNQQAIAITESCLIGELFRSNGSEAVIWRMKLRRHLVENLRVRGGDHPLMCDVLPVDHHAVSGPEWKRLTTTTLAAALGMDHTNFVRRKGKAKS